MTVPQDGPLNVYVPASSSHFTELGIPVPRLLFSFQDTGPTVSSSYNFQNAPLGEILLSGTAYPVFSEPLSGWTRDSVRITDVFSQHLNRFSVINVTGSFAFLAYMSVEPSTGSAVNRPVACFDGLNVGFSSDLSSVRFDRGTAVSLLTSSYGTGDVHAFLAVRNMATQTCSLYTELGRVHIDGTTTASGLIRFGGRPDGIPAASADIHITLGALWTGVQAEIDETQAKTRLQRLSWSLDW